MALLPKDRPPITLEDRIKTLQYLIKYYTGLLAMPPFQDRDAEAIRVDRNKKAIATYTKRLQEAIDEQQGGDRQPHSNETTSPDQAEG
jgi:hypothetical protein